jgi:hypothetical protein
MRVPPFGTASQWATDRGEITFVQAEDGQVFLLPYGLFSLIPFPPFSRLSHLLLALSSSIVLTATPFRRDRSKGVWHEIEG